MRNKDSSADNGTLQPDGSDYSVASGGGADRSENRNHEMSPMFRVLLQGLYDAVLITDRKGNINETNRRAEKLTRFSAEELQQMRISQLVAGLNESLLAQVSENLRKGLFTVLDATCYRRDGSTFPSEIAVSRIRLVDEYFLVLSIRNIRRRLEAEESIRKEAVGQMERAKTQDDFSGLLNIISLPDLFQLIASSRKSGRLSVFEEDHEESGYFVFDEGQPVFAAKGENKGEAAINELLKTGGESFEFKQGKPEERDDSIVNSTMGLLLEAARQIDELEDSDEED